MNGYQVVGKNTNRVDAYSKVTGKAQYPADFAVEGMLHGKMLQLPVASARIKRIDIAKAQTVKGVVCVLTGETYTGFNGQGVLYADMPVLARERVRSVNDVVALAAAQTPEAAQEAIAQIQIDYEPLPAVYDAEKAMQPEAPKVHDRDNILYHLAIRKGDVEKGFADAAEIIENRYTTQMLDHGFLQPEACLAYLDQQGKLVVHTATQYIHWDRYEIARALKMPLDQVRVINAAVGGAFGGREDMTLQIRAALLAVATQRPVKMVCDRRESFHIHCKRHPFTMYYKTAADAKGRLTAVEARLIGDTGAYASWAPNVMRKAGIHAVGPYQVPHVKVDSYAVYTNNPFAGAMRGFGAAQPPLAHEAQMDALAQKLGIHPFQIRWINALTVGAETATGQVLGSSVGLRECLEKVAAKAGWDFHRWMEEEVDPW